ncbi:unnamed protein product [Penicillium roqueforti FM164]|uniref:Genomic scaffold, ProqFM164S01 n=1 Tax=Penicillium roqueforti (strain FM164) TaxID=1365484 RepID=W6PWC6_PENRF|nr:unnamed protein product [Penicillium roqueforti FM164]
MALAGSVFNTISQLGNCVGLVVTAVIAASSTAQDDGSANDTSTSSQTGGQLLEGYRAAYWIIFAGMVVVFLVSSLGLRHMGKVGNKQDQELAMVERDSIWYECLSLPWKHMKAAAARIGKPHEAIYYNYTLEP